MPHRVNQKGDIGTAKNASDSYDADNIYLSEEGWVYRHFKNSEKSRWWDEILVAGQVKDGVTIHTVDNAPVSQTNPFKLGTDDGVTYEAGDSEYDIMYANLGHNNGDPTQPEIAHELDLESVIIDPATKTYDELGSYRVPTYAQGVPSGWTGASDPSRVDLDEPPYPGDSTFVALPNEYNIHVNPDETGAANPLPGVGYEQDPSAVVIGVSEITGVGGGFTTPQTTSGGSTPAPDPTPDPIIPPSPAATNPQTPETGPLEINGYYPLYNTEAGANFAGGGTHTHLFNGVTYYMPNTGTYYHGTYNAGGGSSY